MDEAEAASRKNRKPGAGTDALVQGARLAVLEKYLGIPMKRFREPDRSGFKNPGSTIKDEEGQQKDQSTIVWREGG